MPGRVILRNPLPKNPLEEPARRGYGYTENMMGLGLSGHWEDIEGSEEYQQTGRFVVTFGPMTNIGYF
jgi:hypothetical protein